MILTKDIGIDLGTENTLICDRKGRILIREPSVVAVDVKSRRVLATGNEAKAMIGRTPGSIIAVKPLQDGVIADFDMTADMLCIILFTDLQKPLCSQKQEWLSPFRAA